MDRIANIRQLLQESFAPSSLEIIDESHLHAGHAGARDGAGHYVVKIVSSAFADKNPVQRHQAVYAALSTMMKTEIHALSIQAKTPEEH